MDNRKEMVISKVPDKNNKKGLVFLFHYKRDLGSRLRKTTNGKRQAIACLRIETGPHREGECSLLHKLVQKINKQRNEVSKQREVSIKLFAKAFSRSVWKLFFIDR